MARFETWMKRFALLRERETHERVLTHGKVEILTSTQACRFKHLQRIRFGERREEPAPGERAWYRLAEASAKTGRPIDELLLAAAEGELRCYVSAANLRGSWYGRSANGARRSEAVATPQYLALTAGDCGDIVSCGSANVSELEPPDGAARPGARYRLVEPLRVDPGRIVLKHPLPAPVEADRPLRRCATVLRKQS